MKEKKRGRPSFAEKAKQELREAKKAEKLKLKGMGLAKGKAGTRSALHPIQAKPKDKNTKKLFKVGMEGRPSMSRDAAAENESGLMQAVVNLTSACMQLIKDNQTLIREVCQPLDIKFKQGMIYTDEKESVDKGHKTKAYSIDSIEKDRENREEYKSAVSPKVIVDGAKKARKSKEDKEYAAQAALTDEGESGLVDDIEDEFDDSLIEITKPKKRGRPAKQKALPAPVDEEIEEEFIDEEEEEEETEEDGDDGLGFSDDDDLSDVPFGAEPPSRKTKANGKIKHSPDLEDILS